MRQILLFTLIFLQITQVNLAQNKTKSAKGLGYIELLTPEFNHHFTLREDKLFSWNPPDNFQLNQPTCYDMKIFKMDKDDNPVEIINSPAYRTVNIGPVPFANKMFKLLDTMYFASGQYFAWQVKATRADTVFAASDVFTFKGPDPYEYFWSGNHKVHTTVYTKINPGLDSLWGTGNTKIFNQSPAKTIPVTFQDIKVVSGKHNKGTVHAYFSDTLNLTLLQGEKDIKTPLYLDSLIIMPGGEKSIGNFKPKILMGDDTLTYSFKQWISLDKNDYPLGKIYLNDTTIKKGDFIYEIADSSYISYNKNSYNPVFYGTVKYPHQNDTLELPISGDANLSYFNVNLADTFELTENLHITTSTATIDCDSKKSPGAFAGSADWKGIYYNELKIENIKLDSSYFIDLDSKFEFKTVKNKESCALLYFSDNKLQVELDTSFSHYLYYNHFLTFSRKLKINNIHDTLECDLQGEIEVPYLPNYMNFKIYSENNKLKTSYSSDDNFNFFPLYEFELRDVYLVMRDDTIKGKIDHDKKTIYLDIPHTDYLYELGLFFDISAHQIRLSSYETSLGNIEELKFWEEDDSFDKYHEYTLEIESYDKRIISYDLFAKLYQSLGVEKNKGQNSIRVYPNPVEEYLYISGLQGKYTISLLDTQGNLKLTGRGNKKQEKLNLSALPKGIYLVKIESNKIIYNKKIIKI